MDIRSNKVRVVFFFFCRHRPRVATRQWLLMVLRSHRDINYMDGAQWDGHGAEFSGTGGLRGNLVNLDWLIMVHGLS